MKKAGKATETKRMNCRACKQEQLHQVIDEWWCCWYCGEKSGPVKDEKTARTPGVQPKEYDV